MTTIQTSTVPENGLPVSTVALGGTRALTVLVAFDAGARNERAEENGMAHFLEHLVFKGGEKYATYKQVNETAERLGGVLNAYTSHDLVAFHLTVRAESAPQAIDLLSDFVGRPRLDAEGFHDDGAELGEVAVARQLVTVARRARRRQDRRAQRDLGDVGREVHAWSSWSE